MEAENGENGLSTRYFELIDECDGFRKLEALQEDENDHVYQRAIRMLHEYCEVEMEEEMYESEAPTEFNFACA